MFSPFFFGFLTQIWHNNLAHKCNVVRKSIMKTFPLKMFIGDVYIFFNHGWCGVIYSACSIVQIERGRIEYMIYNTSPVVFTFYPDCSDCFLALKDILVIFIDYSKCTQWIENSGRINF